MTSDIKAKESENEKQTSFQRDENVDKLKSYQKSKQTLMKEFENRENTSRSDNDDVVTSLNDDVDYVELIVKKKTKIKNLKVKRKYFILQKRNRRFLKSIKNNEIETSSTRRRKITKIDENFLAKILKLKRQRSTINLKSTNLDIYNDKDLNSLRIEHIILLTLLKSIFSISS